MEVQAGMAVEFELTGTTALLFHQDDVEASDELSLWRNDPGNANFSVRGDDRSPPWTWMTYLYHDGEKVALPFEVLTACLRNAGARLILKGTKTFKELTQSGIAPGAEFFPVLLGGKEAPLAPIQALHDLPFSQQAAEVKSLGFRLFVKRAKVGQSKHVRVRPRFDSWQVRGSISVERAELTWEVVQKLFELAGDIGLGDWRPSAPKSPGPYGRFTAKLKRIKSSKAA